MISLGEEHVAYRRLDYPQFKLSVVGGRPFSCGGEKLFRKKLLSAGSVPYFPIFISYPQPELFLIRF